MNPGERRALVGDAVELATEAIRKINQFGDALTEDGCIEFGLLASCALSLAVIADSLAALAGKAPVNLSGAEGGGT